MQQKLFSLIALIVLVMTSCKSKTDTIQTLSSDVAAFETPSFLEFYKRFGEDSLFQMNHITFPLEGIKSAKDEDTVLDPNFRWTQEEWVLHQSFDDMDGTFVKEFLDLNGIVVEIISDPTGKFSMERRFGKLSQGWHLIYYREMGMFE